MVGPVIPVSSAGVTGAAIGLGVAVAGAVVVLNDKKTREKVKEVFTNVKDQTLGYVENMQKQTEDKKSEVEKKLAQGAGKVKKTASLAENSLHQDAKEAAYAKS